ncbi:hypothetical protein QZJ98_07980 [Acinetobacter baumannii]|nr:hypothetical protein [Acinetobacter baumannii]
MGDERVRHQKIAFDALYALGLLKPTGNVGQQAKDSIRFSCRQAWEMTFVLK